MGRDLSGANAQAVKEFCLEVKQKLMTKRGCKGFGSVARGNATAKSDIDVLILVELKASEIRDIIAEIVLNINLKNDVVISPVIISKVHYSNALFQETAFYRNLEEEGISI